MLRLIGNVEVLYAAVIGVLSVVEHARVPWWRSEMGRHLMAYMTAFAAVLVLSSIRILTNWDWSPAGPSSWFDALRLAVFTSIPIVMTWRLWLQIKARRDSIATDRDNTPLPRTPEV